MTAGVLIGGLLALTVIAWLGLEAFLKLTGRPLITDKVREWTRYTGGLPAVLFGLVVGLLSAHFWWCG